MAPGLSPAALFSPLLMGYLSHHLEIHGCTPRRSPSPVGTSTQPVPKHTASTMDVSVAEWGLASTEAERGDSRRDPE